MSERKKDRKEIENAITYDSKLNIISARHPKVAVNFREMSLAIEFAAALFTKVLLHNFGASLNVRLQYIDTIYEFSYKRAILTKYTGKRTKKNSYHL